MKVRFFSLNALTSIRIPLTSAGKTYEATVVTSLNALTSIRIPLTFIIEAH